MKYRITITSLLFILVSIVSKGQENQVKNTHENSYVYVENGRLYHPNGKEVALWGVNLQPMLSWEYNSLMSKVGIMKDAATWKEIVDESLDELELMNSRIIRAHLTPADFTDADGGLVRTIYLDMLDYTIAEAAKRGIYSYITFLNHMGNYEVQESFMQNIYEQAKDISSDDRKLYTNAILMFDDDARAKSENFITNLLNRSNPYADIQYKNDSSILVWEIVNEPIYMTYTKLKLYNDEYSKYQIWLTNNGLTENEGLHYPAFRKEKVSDYINGMYDLVKGSGAKQVVSWNCNWHRMITGREDVFEAIAESKMDVISFCNYPGQGVASQNGPYWDNPIDLSRYDFSSWYKECFENRDWYGWALEPRFADKAKVVYEFETFYNQSAYLYPVMADFLRSMGVQIATMWHYSMPAYAQYRSGSHFLNLKCTPRKAASFVVASKLFENKPILQAYHTNSTTEWEESNYMYSYAEDLSIYSSEKDYITSGTIYRPTDPMPESDVKHITGYGSSPLVKYCGTGIYDIHISDTQISIHLEPNSGWVKNPWGGNDLKTLVTELDYERKYAIELRLDSWNSSSCVLYRIENSIKTEENFFGGQGLKFIAQPGDYIIEKK